MKKVTIKAMREWIKTLEENRYRKVYYPDARRVAWFVNNNTMREMDMPETMLKKWKLAEYKREKYLAQKYIDEILSKKEKENITESVLRRFIRKELLRYGKKKK